MIRLLGVLTATERALATLTCWDGTRTPAPPTVDLELAPLPWVRPLSTVLLVGGQRN